MEIFWRLVLGHLIGDFTLQTNYIAAWKRRNIWGMLVHCAIHPVLYSILLWNYMGQAWLSIGSIPITGWLAVSLIFISHFIEDQWRVWAVNKRNAPDNTFFYIFDQVVHYSFLYLLAPSVRGSQLLFFTKPPISGVLPLSQAQGMGLMDRFMTVTSPEPWVIVAILLVIVTHFTTVSIYFLEKDFFGKEFPNDSEKYIGMAERLALAVCFILPGKWWIAVVAGWILFQLVGKLRKNYPISWMNLALGNLTALACGIFIRGIFYP